jgi:dihydrolipoamide dehydrogenase
MAQHDFDLIIIGAGPGGYVAAVRAAQLGLKTACVEREYLGGTCLNVGCIPSKALLDSSERYHAAKHDFAKHGIKVGSVEVDLPVMLKRKDEVVKGLTNGVGYLFKKNKVEHFKGTGTITDRNTVSVALSDGTTKKLTTKNILIATGSAPVEIPGFKFDEKRICSSTGGIAFEKLPKKLLIVGGGYIGVELGSVWSRLGTEVTVLEFTERVLPASDREMALQLQRMLEKQGLIFKFGAKAQKAEIVGEQVKVSYEYEKQPHEIVVDNVLVCVGRKPVTDKLGLASVGLETDKKGYIAVDKHYRTAVDNIYAIGDVIGGIMLAHKAEDEGVAVAEIMAGKPGHVRYECCPSVVYTHPELASVGLTEDQARERGEIKIGKAPMMINGRARGMGETDGSVKVIADARTDRLLGVHILAPHASDMIAEAVAVMEFNGSAEDLARIFHAHPTLPEVTKQAAMAVDKWATQF